MSPMIPLDQFAPVPPIGMKVLSPLAEWGFLWANVVICVGLLVWAVRAAREQRSAIPYMCIIGGALTLFLEPTIDSHLQVWWGLHEQPSIISGFGRDLPLLVLPVVTWYFGAGVLLRWHWLMRHGAIRRMWMIYAIEVAAALCLEPPAIALDIWHYYGEQGLRFFGYPIWWPFVGGACNVLGGSLLYKMTPHLRGWRVIIAAPLIPMAVAAVYWGAGWPMFYILNVEPGFWTVLPVSFISIGLAFVIVWLCSLASRPEHARVSTRSPLMAEHHV